MAVLRRAAGVSPISAPIPLRASRARPTARGSPPDFVGVETSLSLIVGRLYQPRDEDSASQRRSLCVRFLRVSPRPAGGVWGVRGQQSCGESHPPPASFYEKKTGGWIRSQAPSVSGSAPPPAAARHVICDTRVDVLNPACLEASFLSLRGPLLCRHPRKYAGRFSASRHSPNPAGEKGWGSEGARASLCAGETHVSGDGSPDGARRGRP